MVFSRLSLNGWLRSLSSSGSGVTVGCDEQTRRTLGMAADHALLKEVALELWNTTKKLRPGLPKAPRAQLVLKALMIIGDVHDQLEAAMVLGLIAEQEPDDSPDSTTEDASQTVDSAEMDSERDGARTVRRRSGSR